METRQKFDNDFKQGAFRIVRETGKPIAQVARELGINEGTLGNWGSKHRAASDHHACNDQLRRATTGTRQPRP